jgi:hypothetical protein
MSKRQELTGLRFGKLMVLAFSNITDKQHSKWLCSCDCGKTKVILGTSLVSGKSKSCGCVQKKNSTEARRLIPGLGNWRQKYDVYRRSAKKRRLAFCLSFSEFVTICQKDCFYCGDAPSNTPYRVGKGISEKWRTECVILSNGVDRVDNSEGYLLTNVVTCCTTCNTMKMSLTKEDFLSKIKKIYTKNFS